MTMTKELVLHKEARTFSDQQVELAMIAAVAEKGADYVYQVPELTDEHGSGDCVYVAGGAPSCLVGHVLHSLGAPLEELSQHEGSMADVLIARAGYGVSPRAIDALNGAQMKQDNDHSWGEALAAFNEIINEKETSA